MRALVRTLFAAVLALGAAGALAHPPKEDAPRTALVNRGMFDFKPRVNVEGVGKIADFNPRITADIGRPLFVEPVDVRLNPLDREELRQQVEVDLNLGIGLRGPPHLRE
jgi:hypothetical protein